MSIAHRLLEIHSALDDALGDSDVTHIESDDELRERYPVQWAAQKLMEIIDGNFSYADDIRAQGWTVAVHNDYRLNHEPHTFWLFTKGDRNVKGEGRTDDEALNQVRAAIASFSADEQLAISTMARGLANWEI